MKTFYKTVNFRIYSISFPYRTCIWINKCYKILNYFNKKSSVKLLNLSCYYRMIKIWPRLKTNFHSATTSNLIGQIWENPLLIGRLPPLAGVEESGSIPCLGPLDTVGEGDLKWGRHRVQADRCLFLRGHIGKNNLKCQNEHCTSCFCQHIVGVVLHVCIRVALVWGGGGGGGWGFWGFGIYRYFS